MFDCEQLYEHKMHQLHNADTVIVWEKKPDCIFYFLEQVRLEIYTRFLLFLVTKYIYVAIRPTRAKET